MSRCHGARPAFGLLLALIGGVGVPGLLLAVGFLEREEERRERGRVRGSR
jgi:hypothetical protein